MNIELHELKAMLTECSKNAVVQYLKEQKPKSDELTQRQAYDEFGESWVKKQFEAGMVKRHRRGASLNSTTIYSRAELMAARSAERIVAHGIYKPRKQRAAV